ncbi:MAG: hypothetical protein P8182_17825 [Deltaproteobacteria bacterium]
MLIAHCGTDYVSEDVILDIEPVEGTKTWKPLSHREIVIPLQNALADAGLKIATKTYSLSANGQRMFAVWQLDNVDSGMAYTLGVRNSMDKSLALGIVAGTKVLVCDNLAFSGEFIRFRRHTKGIVDDLDELCLEAIRNVKGNLKDFAEWHKRLVAYVLRRRQAEVLTFRAMETGVLNPSQFGAFYKLYFEEGAKYGRPDLYNWHEAVTCLNRDKNLFQTLDRNKGLNQVCNEFIAWYDQFL